VWFALAVGEAQLELNVLFTSSGGSKGGGLGGPWPPWFLAGPLSRSSSFDWHIKQITFNQHNFKRFEDFLTTVLTIFASLLGLIGLIIANPIVITTENHHAGETFMLAHPTFFLGPACGPRTVFGPRWFIVFSGQHHAGATNFRCLELEPEISVAGAQPWHAHDNLRLNKTLLRLSTVLLYSVTRVIHTQWLSAHGLDLVY